MNGAELPCGSTLQVEPADPQYKQRQQSVAKECAKCDENVGYYGPASGGDKDEPKEKVTEVNVSGTNGNGVESNNEDADLLDDFFDSL